MIDWSAVSRRVARCLSAAASAIEPDEGRSADRDAVDREGSDRRGAVERPPALVRNAGVATLGCLLAVRDRVVGAGDATDPADPDGVTGSPADACDEPVVVEGKRPRRRAHDPAEVDSLYTAVVDPLPDEPRPDGGKRVVAAPKWPDPATEPRVETRSAGPEAPGETVAERVAEVLYEDRDGGDEWAEQLEFVEIES